MKKYISNAVLSISSYFNKIGLIVPILFLFLKIKKQNQIILHFFTKSIVLLLQDILKFSKALFNLTYSSALPTATWHIASSWFGQGPLYLSLYKLCREWNRDLKKSVEIKFLPHKTPLIQPSSLSKQLLQNKSLCPNESVCVKANTAHQ